MPQPVDLQTEMGRVTQAERVQQALDRASLAAQQRAALEVQEKRVQTETQVQETQTMADRVEAEARRRNPYLGKRRRKPRQEDAQTDASAIFYNANEKPEIAETTEGKKLDLTV